MKKLILILSVILLIGIQSIAQTSMTATVTETKVDEKYKVVQAYIAESKRQVKAMLSNEAVTNSVVNKAKILQLLSDLQTVMTSNKSKFIVNTQTAVTVDSLATITLKNALTTEIARLKAELTAGEDSTILQPQIRGLQIKKNEVTAIIQNWTKVIAP